MKHMHTLSWQDVRVFLMLKYAVYILIVNGYTCITSNIFQMQVVDLTSLCMYLMPCTKFLYVELFLRKQKMSPSDLYIWWTAMDQLFSQEVLVLTLDLN